MAINTFLILLESFDRFFHFSCVLKVFNKHAIFCAVLFCSLPLRLASCDFQLSSWPRLFNRCAFFFFNISFRLFKFFWSSTFVTSLFFAMWADFPLPDPSPPARQPEFALSNRSTVPGRDFFNRIFQATHQ